MTARKDVLLKDYQKLLCVVYLDSRDICEGFDEIIFINCPGTFLRYWKIRAESIQFQLIRVCALIISHTSLQHFRISDLAGDSGLTHNKTHTHTHVSQWEQPVFLMDFLAVMGLSIISLWGLEALWTTPPTTPHQGKQREEGKMRQRRQKKKRESRNWEQSKRMRILKQGDKSERRCSKSGGRELGINREKGRRNAPPVSKTCHVKTLHDPWRAAEHRCSQLVRCRHNPLWLSGRQPGHENHLMALHHQLQLFLLPALWNGKGSWLIIRVSSYECKS